MRLTIRLLGVEVFTITTDPDPADDTARDLSGGTLASLPIEPTPTDLALGFTGGWETTDG